MNFARAFASLLLFASLVAGCADSEPGLDEIDPESLPVSPGTTWIRAIGSGASAATELLVVETEDPATWAEDERRITWARIGYDGGVEIRLGVIGPDGTGGSGEVAFSRQWVFVPEPMQSVLNRRGAYTEAIDPVEVEALIFAANGNQLDVTIGAETTTYSSLIRMVGVIDASPGFDSQAGATVAAMLMKLPMFTSQARIGGFGSGGMTRYLNSPTSFAALVDNGLSGNALTVEVAGGFTMPETTFDYENFQDQDGVFIDGAQVTLVNIMGTGGLSGMVDFTFEKDISDPAQIVTGSLDFTGLTVTDGFGSGGMATMMLEGSPFTIDGQDMLHLDFSPYLPVP